MPVTISCLWLEVGKYLVACGYKQYNQCFHIYPSIHIGSECTEIGKVCKRSVPSLLGSHSNGVFVADGDLCECSPVVDASSSLSSLLIEIESSAGS